MEQNFLSRNATAWDADDIDNWFLWQASNFIFRNNWTIDRLFHFLKGHILIINFFSLPAGNIKKLLIIFNFEISVWNKENFMIKQRNFFFLRSTKFLILQCDASHTLRFRFFFSVLAVYLVRFIHKLLLSGLRFCGAEAIQ